MIDNITVRYTKEDVNVTLNIDVDDNLPYSMAALFHRIIEDSNVNPKLLFDQLSYEYPIKYDDTDAKMA